MSVCDNVLYLSQKLFLLAVANNAIMNFVDKGNDSAEKEGERWKEYISKTILLYSLELHYCQ